MKKKKGEVFLNRVASFLLYLYEYEIIVLNLYLRGFSPINTVVLNLAKLQPCGDPNHEIV